MGHARKIVVKLPNLCYCSATDRTLDMYSIFKEVRYEGNSCYRFTDVLVTIPLRHDHSPAASELIAGDAFLACPCASPTSRTCPS